MSTNKQSLVPNAREALNKFKMEAANEMVKKMIEAYENGMK